MTWPLLVLFAVMGLLFASWAVHPTWRDVTSIAAIASSPDGRFAAISAPLRGRGGQGAIFLADLESGTKTRIGSSFLWNSLRFTEDGHRVFWLSCRRLIPVDCEVQKRDLQAEAVSRSTQIEIPHSMGLRSSVDLSPGGNLLAIADWGRATVYSTGEGRVLNVVDMRPIQDVRFLDSEEVLLPVGMEGRTSLRIWNLETLKTREVATLEGDWRSRAQILDRDRRRLLYSSLMPRSYQLIDLESGERILDLLPIVEQRGLLSRPLVLADGRWVMPIVPAGSAQPSALFPISFLILDPAAPEIHRWVEMESVRGFDIGEEIEPGRLLIGMRTENPSPTMVELAAIGVEPLAEWSTWLLDVAAGTGPELRPLAAGLRPGGNPSLFRAKGGALVRLEWRNGELVNPQLLLAPPE